MSYLYLVRMTVNCPHDTRESQTHNHTRTSFYSFCVALAQVLLVTCLREQTPTTRSMWLRGGTVRLSCYWGESVCAREWGRREETVRETFFLWLQQIILKHLRTEKKKSYSFSNFYDASYTVAQRKYLNHFTVIEYIGRSTAPIFFKRNISQVQFPKVMCIN